MGSPGAAGKLAENVMHFARLLRDGGLPVGPDRVIDALRALEITGVQRREDFYWAMAAVFLSRREHFELYDQAFEIFWRQPRPLPLAASVGNNAPAPLPNRLADALSGTSAMASSASTNGTREPRAFLASARERLQRMDFDSMSASELAQAKRVIASLRLPIPEVATRRMVADAHGRRVDLRASLRAGLRGGSDMIALRRRSPCRRHPPLVVLCDVSGSMSRYSRMLLHFLHAITSDRDRVHTFVFGTQLTNITRHLRHRDVDVALDGVARAVADWSGGTRIGESLKRFNLHWSRRLLGQNAVVLLISDGLDREGARDLGEQMERLHKSCRRLIWLNPLLRYAGFEVRPAGVRAMLPHVDAFLPAHNLDSLMALTKTFNAATPRGRSETTWN